MASPSLPINAIKSGDVHPRSACRNSGFPRRSSEMVSRGRAVGPVPQTPKPRVFVEKTAKSACPEAKFMTSLTFPINMVTCTNWTHASPPLLRQRRLSPLREGDGEARSGSGACSPNAKTSRPLFVPGTLWMGSGRFAIKHCLKTGVFGGGAENTKVLGVSGSLDNADPSRHRPAGNGGRQEMVGSAGGGPRFHARQASGAAPF